MTKPRAGTPIRAETCHEKKAVDWPGEHTMGRIGGTGTAVGGTGTSELGCQLRWRFLGGPEFMVKDTEIKKHPNCQSHIKKIIYVEMKRNKVAFPLTWTVS